MASEQEKLIKEQTAQAAVDVCAGTQSMGPVYRSRKSAMYVPLDTKEAVYSAAQQKKVKNIQYDIMKSSPEETMAIAPPAAP